MLTHPTHDRLIALGLAGMAKALEEQRRQPRGVTPLQVVDGKALSAIIGIRNHGGSSRYSKSSHED